MLGSKLHNIHISVETTFLPQQSNAYTSEFVFAYTISITNNEKYTVQLLRRHWQILDSNGEVREVEGEGVVGRQPVLEFHETYVYTSGCCLRTELGKMHGYYTFINLETREVFEVKIPEFQLIAPHKLN